MSAIGIAPVMRAIFALFMLAAVSAPASAQSCRGAVDSLNFGVIDLTTGNTFDTTGNLHVTCSGTPNTTVRVCQNIEAGSGGADPSGNPRYLLNVVNQLAFNLFQNAGRTTVWGSYTGPANALPLTVTLNASGIGSASAPIYGRVYGSQTGLPAGTYTSSFAGQASITYDYASANTCAQMGAVHQTATPFTVGTNDANTCTISASALSFGPIADTSVAHSTTTTLTANCSLGTAYSISLNSGLNGVTSPMQRAMRNGANQLSYNLFRDAGHALVWGETVGIDVSIGHIGTGSAQSITVFGLIPVQTTPAVGTYHDIVIVTVTY